MGFVAGAGAAGLPWQTIMRRVLRELRMMVGTGTLELPVKVMKHLLEKLNYCRSSVARKEP